jgi:hypothetical protein
MSPEKIASYEPRAVKSVIKDYTEKSKGIPTERRMKGIIAKDFVYELVLITYISTVCAGMN